MGGVIVEMEVVWIVTHPVSAHGVEGRGRCESSQIHFSIEQSHHMRGMPAPNHNGPCNLRGLFFIIITTYFSLDSSSELSLT